MYDRATLHCFIRSARDPFDQKPNAISLPLSLEICSNKQAAGQQALQDKIPEVCSNLVQLTSFSKSAEVRVVSVQCLAAMLKMPYHLLHPQRKQVVAALALAVDDNKRNVRLEAIRCRKAWVSG